MPYEDFSGNVMKTIVFIDSGMNPELFRTLSAILSAYDVRSYRDVQSAYMGIDGGYVKPDMVIINPTELDEEPYLIERIKDKAQHAVVSTYPRDFPSNLLEFAQAKIGE